MAMYVLHCCVCSLATTDLLAYRTPTTLAKTNAKHICFAKGSFMNVKFTLIPKHFFFIYFCYNTLHIIVLKLTGGQGKQGKEKE